MSSESGSPIKDLPPVSVNLADMRWNKTGAWSFFAPVYREKASPCAMECPLGEPVNRYMHLVRAGRWREAWELIVAANPLPAACGRVCYHTCESACNRGELDGAVNIHGTERFLGDMALEERWTPPWTPAAERGGPPVAVVGSGPAGMGCAWGLRLAGYPVVVYERESSPGGMLRLGVPEFRMPRNVLDGELARLESVGVQFRLGAPVEDLAEVARESRAIFLATGAHGSRDPGVTIPASTEGVFFGLEFLKRFNLGQKVATGRHLAVVGGGNTAIDAARAGLRLGAEVSLYYRRSLAEMPAHPEEVREAIGEGVDFVFQAAPTTLTVQDGRVSGLEMIRMRMGAPDASGRARPEPVPGSAFHAPADTVVFAIGETPELGWLPADIQNENGRLRVDALLRTTAPGVFAGGDLGPGINSVSHALADGVAAARNMHTLLAGLDLPRDSGQSLESVAFAKINTDYFEPRPRQEAPTTLVKNPLGSRAEIAGAFSPEQAVAESSRCFDCGTCVRCDNCLIFCPDLAIQAQDGAYAVRKEYCKGCGICAQECPRYIITMEKKP
ncbi:FAD-dependent oxidoreductase [bacterium]|nr:FAD-dependent oxidoreductase [bacterium]